MKKIWIIASCLLLNGALSYAAAAKDSKQLKDASNHSNTSNALLLPQLKKHKAIDEAQAAKAKKDAALAQQSQPPPKAPAGKQQHPLYDPSAPGTIFAKTYILSNTRILLNPTSDIAWEDIPTHPNTPCGLTPAVYERLVFAPCLKKLADKNKQKDIDLTKESYEAEVAITVAAPLTSLPPRGSQYCLECGNHKHFFYYVFCKVPRSLQSQR